MFVFFDIGDTLVDESDFARLRTERIFEALRRHGLPMTREQYARDLDNLSMQARMTLFEQLRWLAERAGGDTLEAMSVFRDYILHVAPEAPARFRPFPDALECLRALVGMGGAVAGLGIIANQPTWIRARMREWGLLAHFAPDGVVISDEVAVSKPRPEIFRFALRQTGATAGEAVMVGNDYGNDIEPAKRLGMRTIWVERPDAYAPAAPPVADPAAADARVRQLAEVPGVIRAWAG